MGEHVPQQASGARVCEQLKRSCARAFSSFLLRPTLAGVRGAGAETDPVEEPPDEGNADIPERQRHQLADAPEVLRLRALLSEDRSDEEFEVSLEVLLDRLARADPIAAT